MTDVLKDRCVVTSREKVVDIFGHVTIKIIDIQVGGDNYGEFARIKSSKYDRKTFGGI
jgi:hypothetical protein